MVGGGFACIEPGDAAGVADALADSNANADDDGDGIKNSDDNCAAIANATQLNEDGDRFGDACDPCPPVADPIAIVDDDGDGVSGSCDPFPLLPGDRIALFESFGGAALPAGWVALGNWSVVNGSAVVISADNAVGYLTIEQPPTARLAVSAQLTVDQLFGNGTRAVGPAQMYQPSPSRSIVCELIRNGDGPDLAIVDTGGGPPIDLADSTFDTGTNVTMVNRRDGSAYTCDDGAVTLTGSSTYTTVKPAVGVRTNSTSARVAWVLVVSST